MKKIKIRFVYYYKNGVLNNILAQRKRILGWSYFTHTIDMGYGSTINYYHGDTEEELLQKLLTNVYKTCKDFIEVNEYPSIKIY